MYLPVSLYGKNTVLGIYCMCHVVVVNHIVRRCRYNETCKHEDMLFHKGKYVTPMKFRVNSGISTVFSYIGQSNLLNTCFGLPCVWYTPGEQCV